MRRHRVYWGNHHEKLGLKRMSCASQFTIPDTAGTPPDTGCNYTDTRSSLPNQASCTPDFSYPLVSSISFSYSSPISLFLVHNSTIIAEPKVRSSLSNSLSHDHELTVSTAYAKYSIHRVQYTLNTAYTDYSIHQVQHTLSTAYTEYGIHGVQHTPSTAYTEYSIHRVQHTSSTTYTEYSIHRVTHTPSTPSTQDWVSFLHSNDDELTPECSFSFWRSSLHNRLPSARTAQRLSHIVTFPRLRVY